MQPASLLLYNLFIGLYSFAISVASAFNAKAKLWVDGRRNQRLDKLPNVDASKKRIWVHCASLGEFEQARPVIEKIKTDKPSSFIILTFFSPSGYEIRKNYSYVDTVLYLPVDTAENAQTFISAINPDLALFVKYEFWHHYLSELKRRKIPTVLFAAIFRKEQVFFKWYGGFFRNMLGCFDKIFVQNKESQDLLKGISISSQISFDTRFDRVFQIAQSSKPFPDIQKFKSDYKLLIAGSTWKTDEELLTKLVFNHRDFKGYKYIIAPHNLSEAGLTKLQYTLEINTHVDPPVNVVRLSKLTADNAMSFNVIIVDTMGDLSSIYRYADIAYVGGGFDAGIHNVLEPAVYGLPVIFGPIYQKSAEAKELIEISSAFSIEDEKQLQNLVLKLDGNAEFMKTASTSAADYVKQRLGGVEDIYNCVVTVI